LHHNAVERTILIHTTIKNLSKDTDLSNPTTFIELPFPTPLAIPISRFHTKRINGVYHFPYMGRTKFMELKRHVESDIFQRKHQDIYLFGSSGSGKSHILAALVVRLVQEGKKVIYIPDCNGIVRNFERSIRSALYFAFYGDPEACTAIEYARGVDDLIEIAERYSDKYLVVDQLNVLESGDDQETKQRIQTWLLRLAYRHRYIYSATADLRSSQDIGLKEVNLTVIQIYGPMDEVRCTLPNPTS
jgi:hypothetical protein